MIRTERFPGLLTLFLSLLLAAGGAGTAAAADGTVQLAQTPAMPNQADYSPGGATTCMKCHDTPPVTLVLNTPHALRADKRTPFASHDCETCHGPSPDHMVKPAEGQKRAEPAIVFGKNSPTPAKVQNKVCLDCHQGGLRMHWSGSKHDFADVPCASCHEIHALKDKVLVKATQPDVCFNCHVAQRSQSLMFSHHPIREGKVVCSDCHNPHGSFGPKNLAKLTINETCYGCHAEKRGPFLWEHAPVREDCTNCHTPHGATQPRLLKIRAPWLCNSCHSESFHPSTLRSGTGLLPPQTSRLVSKQCMSCHSMIHGSNHPSGARLLR